MASKIHKGFTLIELLIAIGIMALLSGGIFAGYARYNKYEKLRQAGATLKSNLNLARSEAMSGNKPSSGCTRLTGYAVSFSTSSYTIQAQCSEGMAGPQITVQLPPSMTMSWSVSPLVFGVLNRGTQAGATLTITDGSKSLTVTVTRIGNIYEGTVL